MEGEGKNTPRREPLPTSFSTLEEAGAFWDSHSSAEYEDQMEDVDVDVDLGASKIYCALDRDTARRMRERARREGISVEELLTRWLREKLTAA